MSPWRAAAVAATAVWMVSCSGGDDRPYLEFIGGGFIFNYGLASADYGFVAKVTRTIPVGTVVEAQFEDPGGGEPIVVRRIAAQGTLSYVFRTPEVHGVQAGRDYHVVLRLIEPHSGAELARYGRSFRSDLDQRVLPDSPPVVGPGYQPAPPGLPLPPDQG